MKLSPTVGNEIRVTWSADYGRRYAIAIYLVRKLSSAELLSRLKNRGVRHSDYTRGLSKQLIFGHKQYENNSKQFFMTEI